MIRSALVFFLSLVVLALFQNAFSEVLYTLDFTAMKEGNAEVWLKENKFNFELDAKDLDYSFKNGSLVVFNKGDINGVLYKEIDIQKAKRVRIEWGVNQYATGIGWEKGQYRDTIMVMITFGKEKISSGSLIIPNLPYFIGIFLAENEEEGKAYTGSYYKKGGRYYCTPCKTPIGKTVVTDFDLAEHFKKSFEKSDLPPVSALVIETDTRDLKHTSEAFIRKIEFFSE